MNFVLNINDEYVLFSNNGRAKFVFYVEDKEEIAVVRSLEEWNSEMKIKIGTNLLQEILNMDDGSSYWDTEMYCSVKREINELY